jgi:serine/threonine-protein kinase
LTLSGALGGTPRFLPLEQLTDFRSARSAADQFSAAATLYHLITGGYIYEADSYDELFRRMLTEDPVPVLRRRPDLPSGLAPVIHRALARRPEDRFPDVGTLAVALTPFA